MGWNLFCISVGAALGANLRYAMSLWAAKLWGVDFPYGTMIINVLGSFFIGLLLTWGSTRGVLSEGTRLFCVTGLLGGFTTFSTFSYEAITLASSGRWDFAALYVGGSTVLGLAAAVMGGYLARLA